MKSIPLTEARSTIFIGELLSGTKETQPRVYATFLGGPLVVTGLSKDEITYMKQVKYTGICDGQKPLILFFDYVAPEVPGSMFAQLIPGGADRIIHGVGVKEVDAKESVVRVNCGCNEYKAWYGEANSEADVQYGIRLKRIDARDYGYKKAEVNTLKIPGLCRHLISLYSHLKKINKI